MFSFFSNKLTRLSGNYIDFSRMGILLRSNHRYTKEEIFIRGGVILFIAASGFLATHLNDEKVTNCSSTTVAIAGAALGLMGSHVIFGAAIYKRFKMGQTCKTLSQCIKDEAKEIADIFVDPIIEKIFAISLETKKNSNASQTWGRRKKLLTNLLQGLECRDETLLEALKKNDLDEIMDLLQHDLTKRLKLIR